MSNLESETLSGKLGRFIRLSWRDKCLRIHWRINKMGSVTFPRLVRTSFGARMIAWPDVMGNNLLSGVYDEDEFILIKWLLKNGQVTLDVGAHNGFYTLLAAKSTGMEGCVMAFEPSARERRRLKCNLMLNGCRNVIVRPLAVGSSPGETEFYVVEGKETGFNSRRPPGLDEPTRRIIVPMTTLDSEIEKYELNGRITFVKMDVEGGELDALKGAIQLFARQPRPILLCEVSDLRTAPHNYRASEIRDFLERLGYQWFIITKGGFLKAAKVKERYHENLVAVPGERLKELSSRINPDLE